MILLFSLVVNANRTAYSIIIAFFHVITPNHELICKICMIIG